MKKKKRKIKLKSIIIFFVIILVIGLFVLYYINKRVTNIYVIGNSVLKESYIIDKTNLISYPKIIEVNTKKIENTLLSDPLIEKVNVKKNLFGKVTISIEENIPILKMGGNLYILSNGEMEEINFDYQVPFLKGEVDADVYDNFIKKMLLIDKSIMLKISEVEYAKTEFDNERFLLYMNDGNLVYVTLSKIELINTYNEVYPTLGDNKGIFYLDSGNYFEKKEKEAKTEKTELIN